MVVHGYQYLSMEHTVDLSVSHWRQETAWDHNNTQGCHNGRMTKDRELDQSGELHDLSVSLEGTKQWDPYDVARTYQSGSMKLDDNNGV